MSMTYTVLKPSGELNSPQDATKTTSNVTTTVTKRHWTDGYHVIFTDGSQIHHHTLSDQDQKSYVNEFPQLYIGNDAYKIRKSYYEVVDHGQSHGIFVIPYLML